MFLTSWGQLVTLSLLFLLYLLLLQAIRRIVLESQVEYNIQWAALSTIVAIVAIVARMSGEMTLE